VELLAEIPTSPTSGLFWEQLISTFPAQSQSKIDKNTNLHFGQEDE
jgi:hypothetical protein